MALLIRNLVLLGATLAPCLHAAQAQSPDTNGWLQNGQLTTGAATYSFQGGYPTPDSSKALKATLAKNRAVELYLSQMPTVSWYNVWKGVSNAERGVPNQLVIWEHLMDSQTLLLTGNTETVYGMAGVDLKRDGPVVIEVPPRLLGGVSDIQQTEVIGIGPTGADRGKGGKFLLMPPDYRGKPPAGYRIATSRTNKVVIGVRGFLVNGKTDDAVALMKQVRIYPLNQAKNPPQMVFVDGSGKEIRTVFPDTAQYFADLDEIVQTEPSGIFSTQERFYLASIGIAAGTKVKPDADQTRFFADAAALGGAVARDITFASNDPARLAYADRRWEWIFVGGSASWDSQGYVNTDRRAAFSYAAIGMSPAMVQKVVGQGSQYFWTMRDAGGAYLDGGKSYKLHIPANVPVKNFWSLVVYDAQSRSMLRNGNPFPSVSGYTGPAKNADGSVELYFGPNAPAGKEKNWVRTVAGKGWFPILRFYGPLQPFFDKTWKPGDIEQDKF